MVDLQCQAGPEVSVAQVPGSRPETVSQVPVPRCRS